jgi:hypothetical protein
MDKVPEPLRTVLLPYNPSRYTASDKLLNVQSAFVKWFISQLSITVNAKAAASDLQQLGEENRFWTPTYKPVGVEDFHKYLRTRIKNERKPKGKDKRDATAVDVQKMLAEGLAKGRRLLKRKRKYGLTAHRHRKVI